MSLQYLSDNKYAPAHLYGVSANICADLSSKGLDNDSYFMTIVGQDKITAGKKFESEITFLPYTKLIFSCNIIPATRNKTNAFYRRWCILEFNKQTKLEDVDVDMREKLRVELSGIFNWAIEGLERLLKNRKLSYPLSTESVKDIYERGSDSIQSFVYKNIDCENDEGALKKRDVYKRYVEYCNEVQPPLKVENQIKFGRDFFNVTGCGVKRLGTLPAYSGVSFKNVVEEDKIE
jgi:putative DNA primase/helicase